MTDFIPIKRIAERIERDKDNSNSAFFSSLLLGYELTVKLTVAAFVGSLQDDKDRHRYRFEHRLVRASGLGEWVSVLQEMFTGPAAASLSNGAVVYRNELMQKSGAGDYRYDAVNALERAMKALMIFNRDTKAKPSLFDWFTDAVTLRNKTRGHGATTQAKIDAACLDLSDSLQLVFDNFSLFSCPWAYLRRNYSGKYRVCALTANDDRFDHMRTERELN